MKKTIKAPLARTLGDEQGSISTLLGLMALPMVALIGVTVDYSRAMHVQNELQSSLDAAALAAEKSQAVNPDIIGQAFFKQNFSAKFTDLNPTVHFDPQLDGSLKATANVAVPMTISAMLNIYTVQVEAFTNVEPQRSVEVTSTEESTTSTTPCLHVMDQSSSGSLELSGNSNLAAGDCTVHVRSNKSDAFKSTGGNNVKFKKIRVKGGANVSEGDLLLADTAVTIDASIVGNPYLDAIRDVVQAVTVGNCTSANTNKSYTNVTVSPGTYCGSTTFSGVTFNPGLYIIASASGNRTGQLRLNGAVNGSAGVTFYMSDNKAKLAQYTVSPDAILKAPTTGITRGILFFEDSNRGSNWSLNIDNVDRQNWTGLVYLPSVNMTLTNIETWKLNISMAVNELTVSNSHNVEWKPYTWTPFNRSEPISMDETDLTTTTSVTERPLYIKQ